GLYEHHHVRTRHFDAIVRDELAAGVEQVVVLGAGLDTRAYRFADALAGRPVFEVDLPATQAWKRARLEAALGRIPDGVRYVGVDFLRDRLDERLAAAGFDRARRALFTWEGV